MLTREEVSTLAETVHNGDLIDWVHWAQYPNITPTQAARLAKHIDPIKWLKDYSEGKLPDDLRQEITRLTQWLDGHSQSWTLPDLVAVLGDDLAPFGMVQATKPKPDVVSWSGDIQALEPLTVEQRRSYKNMAAWTWVDAIYILQGFKPCQQLGTEQIRSHFISEFFYFTDAIELGSIGKERQRAGEKTFIDSPENWENFWQNKLKTEQQAEAVKDVGIVSHAGTEPKPREGHYKLRDDFAIKQVKDRPELLEMRAGAIKDELQKASNLFTSGINDWWRENPIFKKSKSGRNQKSN